MPVRDHTIKADAGKLQMNLLFSGCPRSLLMMGAVLTYGAQKYSAHGWKNVETERYLDAKWRHALAEYAGLGDTDDESGIMHAAHELTNALFAFEQTLSEMSEPEFKAMLKFKEPPQEHKVHNKHALVKCIITTKHDIAFQGAYLAKGCKYSAEYDTGQDLYIAGGGWKLRRFDIASVEWV